MKIGVLLPQPGDALGEWLADAAAFEAAGADALCIDSGPELDPLTLTAAVAALTYRSLLVTPAEASEPLVLTTVERLSGGRVTTELGERWARVPVPEGREAWRTALAEAAERGDEGVLVPADPRLLDILRNPGDPGGRQDLQLAQG